MQRTELKDSLTTLEEARKNVNRQLVNETASLKELLRAERKRASVWKRVAILSALIGSVGWVLWIASF